jgi:hypothetical protein
LKPLPELSAQLGWDEELLSYAIYAADVLSERGTDEDMATLVAFTLAVAFRLGISGEGDELLVPFMQVGVTAARWADGSDSRRQLLDAALQDSFPGDAAAELWSLVDGVVEAIEAS